MEGDRQQLDERLQSFLHTAPDEWTTLEVLEQEGPFEYVLVADARTGREAVRTRLVDDLELRARGFLARSVRELLVTGRLAHPGVAPVHDVGQDDEGRPYVVRGAAGRRRLTFDDLARRSRARDPAWPLLKAVGVLARASEALAFAHERGWAHGDLGPRHVAASADGATEVAGWAFAQPLPSADDSPTEDVSISLADLAVAHPSHARVERTLAADAFTAPEVAGGDGPSARSDVYALGALLYLLLAGHAPYDERGIPRSTLEVRRDLLAGPPVSVGHQNPLAPAALRAIVQRAMARDPAERYPNAQAVRASLDAWLESNAYGATRRSAARELRAWAGRHRIAAILGGTALAFVVAWALHASSRAGRGSESLSAELEQARALVLQEREALQRAEGRRLTMLGRWLAPQDPTLALRFAILGAKLEPGRLANDVLYEALAGQREIRRFYTHDDAVDAIELSADGSRLLTRDRSGLVQVHDVEASKVLLRLVLPGRDEGVARLAPQGDRVLTIADVSRIVDVSSGSALHELDVPNATVGAFDSAGQHVLVGGSDGGLHLFDATSGSAVWSASVSEHGLDAVRLLGDGTRMASLDRQGVVRVSDRDGEELWSADTDGDGEAPPLRGVLASDRDGRRLAAWTARGMGRIFDAASGRRLHSFGDQRLAAHPPALSSDGARVFAYLGSRSLDSPGALAAVADLETNKMLAQFEDLPFLRAPVRATFSPDGRFVAVPLGDRNALGLWEAATGRRLLTIRGHDEPVTRARYTPDGLGVWSASLDQTARLWEIYPSPSNTGLPRLTTVDRGIVLTVDASGDLAVTAGRRRESGEADLTLVSTRDGSEVRALGSGHVSRGRVTFSDDGTRVGFTSAEGEVHVVDVADGGKASLLLPAEVVLLLLDANGQRLAALLRDGRVAVADVDDGAWQILDDGSEGLPRAASLSANGTRIALAREDRLKVLDAGSGEVVLELPSSPGALRDLQLDPDASRLAWVTSEGQVRVVEVEGGRLLGVNRDLPRGVSGLAYAPDGRACLAWSPRAVFLLDGRNAELVARIAKPPSPLLRASFDASSTYVVTASQGGLVRRWPLDRVAFATSRLPAPVHPGQLRQYDVGTREEWREAGDRYVDAGPSAYALYGLGRARLLVGLAEEAERRFEESRRLRPDLPWGEYGMALLHAARVADALTAAGTRAASRETALEHLRLAEARQRGSELNTETDPLLAPLSASATK